MRGILTAVIALSLISLTVVPSTASADFHPVCEPPPAAYANVELHAPNGSNLTYSGGAYCPGTEVTIVELKLIHEPQYGVPSQVANVTAPACSSTTTQGCTVTDDAPRKAGFYTVNMTFHVDDPSTEGIDFPNVTREGHYRDLGVGTPVPLCVSAGAVPVMVGTCSV